MPQKLFLYIYLVCSVLLRRDIAGLSDCRSCSVTDDSGRSHVLHHVLWLCGFSEGEHMLTANGL